MQCLAFIRGKTLTPVYSLYSVKFNLLCGSETGDSPTKTENSVTHPYVLLNESDLLSFGEHKENILKNVSNERVSTCIETKTG